MDFKTVYEVKSLYFSFTYLIPLILFILSLLFVIGVYKESRKELKKNSTIDVSLIVKSIVSIGILVISFLSIVLTSTGLIEQRDKYYVAYNKGEYQVITGTISQFHPAQRSGHNTEHFYVGNVYFEYGGTIGYGYHKEKVWGGSIKSDEQWVRISYIYDSEEDQNVIVRLELEDK